MKRPTWASARARVVHFLHALDVGLVLAVCVLVVTVTICLGFWQRGEFIDRATEHIEQQSEQLDKLIDDNDRLHTQLEQLQRTSATTARRAERQRDALAAELLRLNAYLKAHGITVPRAVSITYVTHITRRPGGGGPSAPSPHGAPSSSGHDHGKHPHKANGNGRKR